VPTELPADHQVPLDRAEPLREPTGLGQGLPHLVDGGRQAVLEADHADTVEVEKGAEDARRRTWLVVRSWSVGHGVS
jgi:hypothetical protein